MNFYTVICGLMLLLASAQAFYLRRGNFFSPNARYGNPFPVSNFGYNRFGYNRFSDDGPDGPDFDDGYYRRGYPGYFRG